MALSQEDNEYFKEMMIELINMPEIKQLSNFIQHGTVTCLEHSIGVAYISYYFCKKLHLKVDYPSLIRGALLHDYFLYDWHIKDKNRPLHGFYHPKCAYENAKKDFCITKIEKDIILKHMWPLTLALPKYKESFMVSMADKFCSILETFRVEKLIPQYRV